MFLVNGTEVVTAPAEVTAKTGKTVSQAEATKNTMAYGILKAHNTVATASSLE